MLGPRNQRFWLEESYDHWIRNEHELIETIAYVEDNPVKAGFVTNPKQRQWSSAHHAGRTTKTDRPSYWSTYGISGMRWMRNGAVTVIGCSLE